MRTKIINHCDMLIASAKVGFQGFLVDKLLAINVNMKQQMTTVEP